MSGELVNVDNFVRVETDRLFTSFVADAGGVGRFKHNRAPTPIDHQPVIRMNRDTLYSLAVLDISDGAVLTIPEVGDRYASVMVVNQDHHINRVLHEPGEHTLTVAEFDTQWVAVAVRVLVDPGNAEDIATVNALQDGFAVEASSSRAWEATDYDAGSLDATREPLLELARGVTAFDRMFGSKGQVDPVRHLIGTAAGWGGLPDHEASYLGVEPRKLVGEYRATLRDVPVDGFWSVSVYNRGGYFEPNDRNAYSVNDLTATPNHDGSVTVHFGGDDGRPNLSSKAGTPSSVSTAPVRRSSTAPGCSPRSRRSDEHPLPLAHLDPPRRPGGSTPSAMGRTWSEGRSLDMKKLIGLLPLAALMAACEDAGNAGDDNLLTGASLVVVVIIVVVVVLLVRRRRS